MFAEFAMNFGILYQSATTMSDKDRKRTKNIKYLVCS